MGCVGSREMISPSTINSNSKMNSSTDRVNSWGPNGALRKWLESEKPGDASPTWRQGQDQNFGDQGEPMGMSGANKLRNSHGPYLINLPYAGMRIRYAAISQRGYYPNSLNKENQDDFGIYENLNNDTREHFFGVFDGHGKAGTACSQFVQSNILNCYLQCRSNCNDTVEGLRQAHLMVNDTLRANTAIDDSLSGTTAISIFIDGRRMITSNVGDSRAVLGQRIANGRILAVDLSSDHTPMRKDEATRVEEAGGQVLTWEQVDGLKDRNRRIWEENEFDHGDPPRVWSPNEKYPGTAFSRSIGDAIAKRLGVIADPEIFSKNLDPSCKFFVIASDGVFEFLSSQAVVDIVTTYNDPELAAEALVDMSYRLWLQHEERTDDITCIVGYLDWNG